MRTARGPRSRLASLVSGSGRRRALSASQWLCAGIGLLLIVTFNPVTLERWWLRDPFVSRDTALRAWCWDLAVLAATLVALAAARFVPRRRQDRRAPPPGAKILVAAASLLVCAVLLEGALRLVPGEAFSEDLHRELRWRGRHAQPFALPVADPVHVFSPALGWEVQPNLRTDGITSNSQGLRGVREYAWEPAAGVRRVLCVGDSFTFGEHLRDEQTMPARLEEELNSGGAPRWEVLNLGVEGYGTDQQWLFLSQKGLRYKPDVVVLGFFEENLRRNVLAFRDYAKPYFTLEGGRLAVRNVPVPAPEEVLARPPAFPPLYLVSFLRSSFEDFRLSFSFGDLAGTGAGRVTLAILDAMHDAVVARGGVFVLMTIPRPILPRGSDTELMLERWARRTKTPFVNLRAAYLELPPAARERLYRGHWTPYGATVTAQLLAERLRPLVPR